MGELFPGPDVRITHDAVVTPTGCYPIWELSLVHVNHENAIDVVLASPFVRICSGTMTGLCAIVAAAGSELVHSPQVTVAGTLLSLGSAVTAARGWWLWQRPRSVWAYHKGARVHLFSSRDRLDFDQKKRALLRALESVD